MKRSKQLLLVYAELRSALTDMMTAREALETAERLVDLANYREVIDRCGTADDATPGCVPVDRAFDDGGWALLHQGFASGMLGDDESADYHPHIRRPVAQLKEYWA